MKISKRWQILAISTLLVGLFSTAATAQKKSKKEKDDAKPFNLKERLWYGAGLNLGFGATQGQSLFVIGPAPMVGLNVWKPFHVGARLGFEYNWLKIRGEGSLNLYNVEPGLFLRAKIFRGVFAHAEVANEYFQAPDPFSFELVKISGQRVNQYIGLGYNPSGGGSGTDIVILYNIRAADDLDPNSTRNLWDYRFGFTWRF